MWARQINSEGSGTRILNDGAPLVILGLKVEQNAIALDNRAPADTEVLGGLLYRVHPAALAPPAFINDAGARLTVAYAESAYRQGAVYNEHVTQAIADGKRLAYTAAWLPTRGMARLLPGATFPQSPASR